MKIPLMLAAGLVLIASAPRFSSAADNTEKLKEKEEVRLERKCAKEEAKESGDEERGRTHAQPENKWDEVCLPPPIEPSFVEPPAPVLPPGVIPPPPPPPAPA